MAQAIKLNESTVSNRIVYIWSVLSNGTSPAQFETGGQPTMSVAGLPKWNSAGTLLAIDTTNGEYCVRLGSSDVSVSGPGVIRYSSASALETSVPLQIVAYDPYDATKLGLTSVSTFDKSVDSVGLKAQTHSQATVFVGGMDKAVGATSGLSFGIIPGDYGSTVTVGVSAIKAATYSGVTVGVNNIDKAAGAVSGLSFQPVPGDYSSTVTVGVSKIKAGTYSGVTVETAGGTFTLAPGTYSDVTVQVNGGTVNTVTGGVSVTTNNDKTGYALTAGDFSSTITVGVSKIKAGTYSAVTIDGLVSSVTVGANTDKTGYSISGTKTTLDALNDFNPSTQSVGLKAQTHSGATITAVNTVNSRVSLQAGDWSDVTVRASNITVATGGIVAASFAAGAIDTVAVASATEDAIADALLNRNVAGGSSSGRTVGTALYALRNKVAIDGSIGTVYQTNDSTSAWTFSVGTVSTNSGLIQSVDPV